MSVKSKFRYCGACHALYYDGEEFKGLCPANGEAHQSGGGFNYSLWYQWPVSDQSETEWRRCSRCQAVFFDGFAPKGKCDAGGEHRAAGEKLVLAHDTEGGDFAQPGWRFCTKCYVLFHDEDTADSHCAGAGNHEPNPGGLEFVISHGTHAPPPPPPPDFPGHLVTKDPGTELHLIDE